MLYSGNTIFFPIVMIGTVMAGGIFTGANPTYNAREVAYQVENSRAKIVICAETSLRTGIEAMRLANKEKSNLLVFDEGYDTFDGKGKDRLDCKHWTSILKGPEEARQFQWDDRPDLVHDTICLNYSSGTTGLPKGS